MTEVFTVSFYFARCIFYFNPGLLRFCVLPNRKPYVPLFGCNAAHKCGTTLIIMVLKCSSISSQLHNMSENSGTGGESILLALPNEGIVKTNSTQYYSAHNDNHFEVDGIKEGEELVNKAVHSARCNGCVKMQKPVIDKVKEGEPLKEGAGSCPHSSKPTRVLFILALHEALKNAP
jgi:hypothetical protein